MIRVTIEVKGRTVSRRMQVTAPSVEQALEMAGAGRPDKHVRVVSTLDRGLSFTRRNLPAAASPTPQALEIAA